MSDERANKSMHVVCRNHKAAEFATLAVEMAQCTFNNVTNTWLCEKTIPVARVEPMVSARSEKLPVFFLLFRSERLRMRAQPSLPLEPHAVDLFGRQRVGQPESDKIQYTVLPPMGQVGSANVRFREDVEERRSVHAKKSRSGGTSLLLYPIPRSEKTLSTCRKWRSRLQASCNSAALSAALISASADKLARNSPSPAQVFNAARCTAS